jgi:hypothetical protein
MYVISLGFFAHYQMPTTTSDTYYNLNVGGEGFVLTKYQIQSDPGNYFATYFLGDFSEAANGNRELKLEKDPVIFKIIQSHLRGYEVFPIPDGLAPAYMTKEVFMKNVWIESQYYGLTNLEEKAKKYYEELNTKLRRRKNYKYGVSCVFRLIVSI